MKGGHIFLVCDSFGSCAPIVYLYFMWLFLDLERARLKGNRIAGADSTFDVEFAAGR